MKRIYISGVIKGSSNPPPPLEERKAVFRQAARHLQRIGWSTLVPFDIAPDHEPCEGDIHSWSCYMKFDIMEMLRCDAIYMLRGWETSPGARLELHVASSCGMRVIFQ